MKNIPCLLIERINAPTALPVDWIALINTNRIPKIGPEIISKRQKDIPYAEAVASSKKMAVNGLQKRNNKII